MAQYRTVAGDMVDQICWRHYGNHHSQTVAALLEANHGLADYGPLLPAGVVIELPDLPEPTTISGTERLWS